LSDARWADVLEDAKEAATHFANAVRLFEIGGFHGDELEPYRDRMAFMHAVQAGHTSFEAALLRVLEILGEEKPTGNQWHRDLIRRAARQIEGENGRPAILSPELARYTDETRRFRNLAVHSYGSFDPGKAVLTVEAARHIAEGLTSSLTTFREAVDPPAN
jgi:hypothetical protein